MMRILKSISMCVLLLSVALNVLAAATDSKGFDVSSANRQFDKMSITLSTQNLKAATLQSAVDELEMLRDQAQVCVDSTKSQLDEVDRLLKASNLNGGMKATSPEYQYLKKRKETYTQQGSECRLFVYRSAEAIKAYKKTLEQLTSHQAFEQGLPIWKIFNLETLPTLKTVDVKKIDEISGVGVIKNSVLGGLAGVLLLALLAGFLLRYLSTRWRDCSEERAPLLSALGRAIAWYAFPVLLFGSASFYLSSIYFGIDPNPTLEVGVYACFIYTLVLAALYLLFRSPIANQELLKIRQERSHQLYFRLWVTATIAFFTVFIWAVLRGQPFSDAFVDLLRTFVVTIFSVLLVWVCWCVSLFSVFRSRHPSWSRLMRALLVLFLGFILVSEALGFHNFAIYLIGSLFSLFLLVALFWVAVRLVEGLYAYFSKGEGELPKRVHYYLGIRLRKEIPDFFMLRLVAHFTLVIAFIYQLMKIVGVSLIHLDEFRVVVFDGTSIGGIPINFYKLMLGVVSFAAIHLIGRLLSTYIARKRNYAGGDRQVAIASIVSYIVFALALLFALLVAGVNFTGLAIIAGALSVGVGLGLQNIVSNFVSGLILLLEKPIKVGDRIIVGETEGFVKRVRIRSTQITTLAREDVIIPNSDLVTEQVTNYMFRDKHWRVSCQVGVAYGSDVERVREVLFEVASNHPDVMQETPNEPVVLFNKFGDSSLIFDLWCIIQDVNRKFIITSELNFAINKAFKENGIVIAFPQRDLHIKGWTGPSQEG